MCTEIAEEFLGRGSRKGMYHVERLGVDETSQEAPSVRGVAGLSRYMADSGVQCYASIIPRHYTQTGCLFQPG